MGDLHSERTGLARVAPDGWYVHAAGIAPTFDTPDRRRDAVARLGRLSRRFVNDPPPRSGLGRLWVQVGRLDGTGALAGAARLDAALADLPAEAALTARADLDLLRGAALAIADRPETAASFARRALASGRLAAGQGVAESLLRLASWRAGDLDGFYAQGRPRAFDPSRGWSTACSAFDRSLEAALEAQQLHLLAAQRLAQDAQDLAAVAPARSRWAELFTTALQAELAYEAGDLDRAWALLEGRLESVRRHATADAALRIYPLLARIAVLRGKAHLASSLLRDGESLATRRGWPRLLGACLQARVDLYVAEGRWEDAAEGVRRLAGLAIEDAPPFAPASRLDTAARLATCRLRLARAADPSVVDALRHLHHDAMARSDLYLAVRVAVRLVEALAAVGEAEEAQQLLASALAVGVNAGLFRCFLDGGDRVGAVLATLRPQLSEDPERRHLSAYAEHLMRHWPCGEGLARAGHRTSGPLSARECDILRLIRRGYSNKRIGLDLGIAFETVKTHAKNIYGKLDAGNRAEAVACADRLGLI
jgi:ATP/maltotriose-dependent transcriptional regulator MalT